MKSPRPPFALLLRSFRLKAGLSQGALAERAGTSVEAVSTLERGVRRAPYRKTVSALAGALELTHAERELFEDATVRRRRPRMVQSDLLDGDPSPQALASG